MKIRFKNNNYHQSYLAEMKKINIYKSNIYINIRKDLINLINLLLFSFINYAIKIIYIYNRIKYFRFIKFDYINN